jgi:hypothetical protein
VTIRWVSTTGDGNEASLLANSQTDIHPANIPDDPNAATAIRASWNDLAEKAVGDHKNCAIEFHLLQKPISLDEAAKRYGSVNNDIGRVILTAISKQAPNHAFDGAELLHAHSCLFAGRRFAHVIIRTKGKLVSVLIADSDQLSDNDEIDMGLFEAKFNVAGFSADGHSVFVVSELNEADNLLIAQSILPAVRNHIEIQGI